MRNLHEKKRIYCVEGQAFLWSQKGRSGTPLDSHLVILPFPTLNSLGLPGKQRWKKGVLILGQRGNLVLQIELKPKFLQQL